MPMRSSSWIFLGRSLLSFGRVRPDVADGCPERFDWIFITWVWSYPRRSRPKTLDLLQAFPGRVVTLRDTAAVRRWIADGMPL